MSKETKFSPISLKMVILKGVILFLLFDFIFSAINPIPALGQLSAYNAIFPGRLRLPFGEIPDQAYNLSLYNLEAMFASHELAGGKKPATEFRVIIIGDSSVWGYLLKPENTLSAYLNAEGIQSNTGQAVKFYNLGYPTLSLAKDFLILNYAMKYQPDLILWLVTLESIPVDNQLDSPIVQNNPDRMRELITRHNLSLNPDDSMFVRKNILDTTLIGERRALADLIRLQLYGVLWAATGIDQYYPENYDRPQEDLENDDAFHGLHPPSFSNTDLSFDILAAGNFLAGEVPIIFINEPIYISHGQNSNVRYNFFYPRWAYDQYRESFQQFCQQSTRNCLDAWNLVAPEEFTNSAIHMTPIGTKKLSTIVENTIRSFLKP